MIGQIMDFVHYHFAKTVEAAVVTFTAPDTIVITGQDKTYLAGQYIYVRGSVLNDGTYKIASATDNVLTLDTDNILNEDTGGTVYIYGLAPSRPFLDLCSEIETWASKNQKQGITSENIDDYSVTFAGDGSWQNVFRRQLAPYRHLYDDLDTIFYRNFGSQYKREDQF